MTDKPKRLGRGLEALLGVGAPQTPKAPESQASGTEAPAEIDLAHIEPNPFQPRRDFSAAELQELEASMKASGLLQPITVRPLGPSAGRYQLVAGERRFRAAQRLGWPAIPAIVRQLDDRAMLTLALVENLQRADLNPIEEADGYQRLIEEFSLTQQQVADAVGKERSTVANLLRLRQLPESARELVRAGRLSAGHARALLALPNEADIERLAVDIVARQMTVRDVERLVKDHAHPASRPANRPRSSTSLPAESTPSAELRHITDRLRNYLQTDVSVAASSNAEGEIRIRFYSADDLDRVLALIIGPEDPY